MFTEYERLQADLVVLFGILHRLAEEGDVLALSGLKQSWTRRCCLFFEQDCARSVG